MENERIAAEKIAGATGKQRELDSLNLFDLACQVDFIITVEALIGRLGLLFCLCAVFRGQYRQRDGGDCHARYIGYVRPL